MKSIFPEDRRNDWEKPKLNYEMDNFCIVEIPDTTEGLYYALRCALSNPSPFSLMFIVKEGKVDPKFVIGHKGGKFKKFASKHFKISNEVYVPGDKFYEGTSDPNSAYNHLYMAYQDTVGKYIRGGKLESSKIDAADVVDKILNEIELGAKKDNYKPVFVFCDFDMNTIFVLASSDKICLDDPYFGDSILFMNTKFLEKFATVWLEHHHGTKPEYFTMFTNESRGNRWTFPYEYYGSKLGGPCRMSVCEHFRGYNPETKKVKCGFARAYKCCSRDPCIAEIDSTECYESLREKGIIRSVLCKDIPNNSTPKEEV